MNPNWIIGIGIGMIISVDPYPGDHVPGGEGRPVTNTDNEGIPLSSAQWMTGSDVTITDPDTSLHLHQSLDHLCVCLTPPITITIPVHSVLNKGWNVLPSCGCSCRTTDY